ncbi:MAG TPA: dihydrolipoamide acetyltransferase family protein [Acidimicrobiales bacterium]|nr:dihydrolipoamide acetyltransferase family protein [Acidimicrobiales bacterium]
MADITMPQLGETVTEGTITKWMKKVGDPVAEDEVLFEVSTDKVDSEVPSPAAGVVSEILVDEGETVDVGTRLAVISPAGAQPAPAASPEAQVATEDNGSTAPAVPPAPSAAPRIEEEEETPELQAEPESAAAPGPESASAPPPSPSPPPSPTPAPVTATKAAPAEEAGSKLLSPVVRKLVAEHNLDPGEIRGTGPGGRITRADVLAVIDRRNGGAPATARAAQPPAEPARTVQPAPAGQPVPSETGAPTPVSVGEHDSVVPFTNIRRRTAEHMVRSKHTSAHTMVAVEVDYSAVERLRQAEKDRFKEAEGFSLTYLPFVTRAVVDALEEFPNVNSSVGDDALIVHGDVNIGIAVDLDFEGLLVPVIHNADAKRLRSLAREISELASRARSKRLTMDDISGGTFTITNAGPFGTFITVPVINQPQVAILSTDGVRKKPVAVELADGTDGIAVHPIGNLVMSWDHRAFDGAYAAAFLRAVKNVIETRDWAAEL